jgi:NADPH-dependent curcumin reductase CurA
MNRAMPLGDTFRGHSIAIVEDAPVDCRIKPGDVVIGKGGWQEFFVAVEEELWPVFRVPGHPLSINLGVLGAQGLSAYVGLCIIGKAQPDDTVIVSGATGVVGSVTAQIAASLGCRTVMLASPTSPGLDWLSNEVKSASIISTADLYASLRAECPEGMSLFFDNVGGPILEGVLRVISEVGQDFARLICCGMISEYNRGYEERRYAVKGLPVIIKRRLTLQGFVVGDYRRSYDSATQELITLLEGGRIQYAEQWHEGLERCPEVFIDMMRQKTFGKQLIKVSDKYEDANTTVPT